MLHIKPHFFSTHDEQCMQRAIELANIAANKNEVPVGAVLTFNNEIIAEGYNQPIATQDPTAHAEMIVLRAASKTVNNYRLTNTTLYVTLEPCLMCAGAMVHARIQRLVYGAHDARTGCVMSAANMLDQSFLNHRVMHQGGLFAEECSQLLKSFFQSRR